MQSTQPNKLTKSLLIGCFLALFMSACRSIPDLTDKTNLPPGFKWYGNNVPMKLMPLPKEIYDTFVTVTEDEKELIPVWGWHFTYHAMLWETPAEIWRNSYDKNPVGPEYNYGYLPTGANIQMYNVYLKQESPNTSPWLVVKVKSADDPIDVTQAIKIQDPIEPLIKRANAEYERWNRSRPPRR
jgi:hypothetical protein